MSDKNYELSVSQWHYTADEGYPADGAWCFIVAIGKGKPYWTVGGYDETEKNFYVNFGFGGAVMEREHVVAWAPFENAEFGMR